MRGHDDWCVNCIILFFCIHRLTAQKTKQSGDKEMMRRFFPPGHISDKDNRRKGTFVLLSVDAIQT